MEQLIVDSKLLESARDLFRYPEPMQMKAFKDDRVQLLQWASHRDVRGANRMLDAIDQGQLDWEALQIDYTGLFVNSFPHAHAHPFAGWYLRDGVVFGKHEQEMRSFYAAQGICMDEETTLPADHIMVELEFAATLMEAYETSGDSSFLLILQELLQHMNSWVPQFTEAMLLYADSLFYKTAAEILLSLMFAMQNEMKGVA